MYEVSVVEDECIGCGLCEGLCPDNFEVKDQNGKLKAVVKNSEVEELGCNQQAADQCPVNCIHISEK